MNLLIVDDEYLVVEEVVTVTDWELLGITEIYSATNAVSAVRILNEKKIDIMICDIEMPQTDGLELSKKAKENFPDLEIVMLTSHAEFNYVRNALRYGCYDYLLKPVMEDDIIKVMKNLVTKIERERHQAQLQEEGIVWNQLKPVWKEKYWEEMLRGLRDDPNRECEEYEEKQWKEEQDRRLIPILFYQYANDKTEEDIKQTRKKVKEDLGTVAGDFLLPVLSQKEFAGLVFISDEWLSSGTERNGIILKDAILQQFKTERLYEKIGICIGEVCTGREVQSMSHIHASMPTPDGKYIAVADCGLDYIYLYDAKTYQKVFEWKAPEDSGPRQLRFSPDGKYLYMVSELSCQIFVFEYQPDCKDMLRNVQVISTRREDGYDRENYTSALQMHPSGRYLLAGNRGHNSIVVYEVDKETGLLMLKGHTMLAGDFCREFCFVPDGSMLIVGIQHTDVVQTFFFDENKGILKWSGQEIVIPSPSCVIMGDSAK